MSTPWRTAKVRHTREEVQPFVDKLTEEMPPDIEWLILGSWRRGAPDIGDLDIMVVTESGTFTEMPFWPKSFKPQQGAAQKVMGDLVYMDRSVPGQLVAKSIHADFWACKPNQAGAFKMFMTGPKDLNIQQRAHAKALGYMLSQYGLLDQNGNQVDDGTEQDIYRILGLDWLEPEERQAFQVEKPLDSAQEQTWEEPSDSGSGTYTVTLKDNVWSCKCFAFTYSRDIPPTCKHIIRRQARLRGEQPAMPAAKSTPQTRTPRKPRPSAEHYLRKG